MNIPPNFFSIAKLSDFNPSPIDEEQELRRSLKKDCVERCRHCHRLENHYLVWRAYPAYAYLLGFSLGLIQLGPYRCRCCGHYLWVRWDLLNPGFYYRWLNGTNEQKKPH